MSFFSVPLSGLNASQEALKAISSNLANVDTDGYKDQNVSFSDIFAQNGINNGALDPLQVGGGVSVASTTSDFSNGTPTATSIPSNMALSGDGFFVVKQTNGDIAYSRAGDFTTNNAGQLVAPDGSLVLGYPAQNGVINTSAALQPLDTGTGLTTPATATTAFSANVNLNAASATNATASSVFNTYDSLGQIQAVTVTYTKTASNTWTYSATVPTSSLASSTSSTPAGATTQVASGTLSFDSNGVLTSPVDATTGKPAPIAIAIPALSDGAAAMNISWNLADASGNSTITQTDLASGTADETQNGNAAGALAGYSIESNGTIQGTFSSGSTIVLGQVAVATVENDQGLQQIGSNLYQTTAGSGQAQVGIAGTGGRGTIIGGSVEVSNVDVASEFSKMIVSQQAYEANAKVVTTFDQVEQATLAMLSS